MNSTLVDHGLIGRAIKSAAAHKTLEKFESHEANALRIEVLRQSGLRSWGELLYLEQWFANHIARIRMEAEANIRL